MKERKKSKKKILIEQLRTLQLFSVRDQLKVTFNERQRAN